MKEKQDMKKRNIIRGFLVLVMVVMTGFFINLEITKADEKNTENYHLIPWDDGQSGTYWMDGYLYWIDMKKKKISFPSALTVLFIVLIFAAILTAVVPAGLYSKLTYNADHDVFEITTPEGEVTEMAPTQKSLDELGAETRGTSGWKDLWMWIYENWKSRGVFV